MTWYSSLYNFTIIIDRDDVNTIAHPGDSTDIVTTITRKLSDQLDKIGPQAIRNELSEYGAWTDDELQNDDESRLCIVWIAACNLAETKED